MHTHIYTEREKAVLDKGKCPQTSRINPFILKQLMYLHSHIPFQLFRPIFHRFTSEGQKLTSLLALKFQLRNSKDN